MIRTTVAITCTLYVALAVLILKECTFLSALRQEIWASYQEQIAWFSALLLNLGATIYMLLRRLALKDTGAKLAHLEKQLRGKATVSKELTERILGRR
jgi:H+/Cl- antiporter ClcA